MSIEEKEIMFAVKIAAEATDIAKCAVEEIQVWEKEYGEEEKTFSRGFCHFVCSIQC